MPRKKAKVTKNKLVMLHQMTSVLECWRRPDAATALFILKPRDDLIIFMSAHSELLIKPLLKVLVVQFRIELYISMDKSLCIVIDYICPNFTLHRVFHD